MVSDVIYTLRLVALLERLAAAGSTSARCALEVLAAEGRPGALRALHQLDDDVGPVAVVVPSALRGDTPA